MRGKLTITIAIIAAAFFSCTEKEPIPNYIHLSDFALTTTVETEGSASNNIKDVWVFINGNRQGVYELPSTFPIIVEGNAKIDVYPGIFVNGISNTRIEYPFYTGNSFSIDENPNNTDTISPVISYVSSTQFKLIEDFEIGNAFNNIVRIQGADVYQGLFSGKLNIDSTSSGVFVASSTVNYSITPLTAAAFIELDYKNNHPFEIFIVPIIPGLQAGPEFIAGINADTSSGAGWNKIYLNLTPTANRFQADEYQIEIVIKPGDKSPQTIEVLIDNFKLLHF